MQASIESVKKQLDISGNDHDEILTGLFEKYLSIAKSICMRDDEPPAMLAIVRDITAGAYNQRGGEGFISSAAGGQHYNHMDLHEVMQKRLINAGLRLARF